MSTIWKRKYRGKGKNNFENVEAHLFSRLARTYDFCDARKIRQKKNKKNSLQKTVNGSLITT